MSAASSISGLRRRSPAAERSTSTAKTPGFSPGPISSSISLFTPDHLRSSAGSASALHWSAQRLHSTLLTPSGSNRGERPGHPDRLRRVKGLNAYQDQELSPVHVPSRSRGHQWRPTLLFRPVLPCQLNLPVRGSASRVYNRHTCGRAEFQPELHHPNFIRATTHSAQLLQNPVGHRLNRAHPSPRGHNGAHPLGHLHRLLATPSRLICLICVRAASCGSMHRVQARGGARGPRGDHEDGERFHDGETHCADRVLACCALRRTRYGGGCCRRWRVGPGACASCGRLRG